MTDLASTSQPAAGAAKSSRKLGAKAHAFGLSLTLLALGATTHLVATVIPSAEAASSFVQRMMMKRFDKNGDGAITFNEFAPLHERIFSRLDRNSDGFITQAEFVQVKGADKARRVAGFARLDKDGNKTLSQAEFVGLAPGMFARMDLNGDGRLTPEEIMSARQKMGAKQ